MADERPLSTGIDPDVDLRVPEERAESLHLLRVTLAVAAGGVLGALARHGVAEAWPAAPTGFPWATFVVNVSGCLALGALMGWVAGREGAHPLVRPFLGTGLLGGYTTFSTYVVETQERFDEPLLALGYLAGSVVIGLAAALVGWALTARRRGTR